MSTPNRTEIRPNVDRPIVPLGLQPRPLLSFAATAIMNSANLEENDKEMNKTKKRREDSTEDLPLPHSERYTLLVSRLIPGLAQPVKSSDIWDKVLNLLREEDISGAKKNLLRLLGHRSKSRSATFNRCRAASLLSVLAIVNEWSSTGALSLTASKRLSEGILLKSMDCIALGTWMFVINRWTLPPTFSVEELCQDLESAAVSGHAASQAVLGLILCQCIEEDSIDPSKSQENHDKGEGYLTDTPRSSSKVLKRRISKRLRTLKPKPDIRTGSKYLRLATSRGYFLAVYSISQAVTKGQNYEKLHKKKLKETSEKKRMWPFELNLEQISSEEYFSWIQNAANEQVAECVFLISKLLRKGIGCRKSDTDSLRWIVMASDMGVPEAFVALRSRAVDSNWKLMDVLASWQSEDERKKSENSILEKARDQVIQNKDIVRLCDEKISKWKKHANKNEKIISLYLLCNLQTKFPLTMSEGLVRLIFERDRAGWRLEGPSHNKISGR